MKRLIPLLLLVLSAMTWAASTGKPVSHTSAATPTVKSPPPVKVMLPNGKATTSQEVYEALVSQQAQIEQLQKERQETRHQIEVLFSALEWLKATPSAKP
jgi:hypothetical protein